MWLIKASVRNPYMVAALVFMILVVGLVVLQRVPVDILPVFKAPAVQVLTYYSGMPATSIEKTITTRIERWVVQAPGAERLESKSVPGVSVIKAYFRDNVDPNGALTLSNSLALGTLPTLPPNTLPPVVLPFDPTGTLPLGLLTVKNDYLDEAHVKDVARVDVRNMLGAVSGSVAPVVVGGKDRTIMVYLKPKELEARGLGALDVIEALQQGNLMTTPGTLYLGKDQILLDSNAMAPERRRVQEIPDRHQAGPGLSRRHRQRRRRRVDPDLARSDRRQTASLCAHLSARRSKQPGREQRRATAGSRDGGQAVADRQGHGLGRQDDA